MKRKRRLAEVEWEIMEGVWQIDRKEFPYGMTVRDIHRRLYPEAQKAYTTVQTILNILTNKGFLKKKLIAHTNFFTPAVSREEMGRRETRSLVSRVYRGSFGALAAALIDSDELSQQEMDRIRALIEEKDRERKKRGG